MRTVIVTGGGRGIGAEIVHAFLREGDAVLIASRSRPSLPEANAHVRWTACDVRRPADSKAVIALALQWRGSVDVLVNNAGMSGWRPLHQVDEMFWDDLVDVNLKGAFFATKAAAAVMTTGASIINISSLAGKRGSANNSVYCAAKFGITGITQALAKELGPRGIRVNAVCPVYVRTPGLLDALADPAAPPRGEDIEVYLQQFALTQSALGRLPSGDEVARACVYLASDAASAITGQSINVDCGVLPQ